MKEKMHEILMNLNRGRIAVSEAQEQLLDLFSVSNQRELLFAFEKFKTSHIIGATDEWRYSNVDLFLSKQ